LAFHARRAATTGHHRAAFRLCAGQTQHMPFCFCLPGTILTAAGGQQLAWEALPGPSTTAYLTRFSIRFTEHFAGIHALVGQAGVADTNATHFLRNSLFRHFRQDLSLGDARLQPYYPSAAANAPRLRTTFCLPATTPARSLLPRLNIQRGYDGRVSPVPCA